MSRGGTLPQDAVGLPEHLSNDALISAMEGMLHDVGRSLERRRNRDRAGARLTELWRFMQVLALRVGNPEAFDGGPAPRRWDDDEAGARGRERWDAAGGDPALNPNPDDDPGECEWRGVGFDRRGVEADDSESESAACARPISMAELLGSGAPEAEEEAADEEGYTVPGWRLLHFGQLLRFFLAGSRELDDVAKKVLAIGRRALPEEMRRFCEGGEVSQAAVSRKLGPGGQRRATVQAREKKFVEQTLENAGFLGKKLAGGQKSDQHRKRCREAQMGNTNRRDGAQRRRGA